ncbi:MAG: hypothetical protein NT141_01530, partial [candidate division WWE3 bacterium]|nr:hypothetical protein [candidate division WWE3 bacterium]
MKALALIYVILGILPFIILTTTLLYGQTEPSGTLVTPALALTTTVVNNKLITRIIIPKLSTNLSVKPAAIVENTWKAFDDAASLAAGTPVNNIVIFAHDKPKMFRGLGNLEINDPIYIMRNKSYETYYV